MPAHGLSLEEVVYPPDDELAARAVASRARRDTSRDTPLGISTGMGETQGSSLGGDPLVD
jgi:hypothetical protein